MNAKSAQILDSLNQPEWSYAIFERKRAEESSRVLRQLLSISGGLDFQKDLVQDYFLVERGLPPRNCYPDWAYQLAFTLYDPKRIYSNEVKDIISYHCKALLDEFGQRQKPLTSYLKQQGNLLADIAKDLDYEKIERTLN